MVFHFVFIIITYMYGQLDLIHIQTIDSYVITVCILCNSFSINIFYLSELAELGGSHSYRLFVDADIFAYTE